MKTSPRRAAASEPLAPGVVVFRPDLRQNSLRSLSAVAAGEVLARFQARARHARPTRETVQIGIDEHIDLSPDYLQFINHSCEPNALFDVSTFCLVTLRDIAEGDEIVYFYPATEWKIANPFACCCGAPGCLGTITGAADLPDTVLARYTLSPVIRQLLQDVGRGA